MAAWQSTFFCYLKWSGVPFTQADDKLSYSCVLFGPKEALCDQEFLCHTCILVPNLQEIQPYLWHFNI